jgi:MFS family permease
MLRGRLDILSFDLNLDEAEPMQTQTSARIARIGRDDASPRVRRDGEVSRVGTVPRAALVISFAGTALEYFDFYFYGAVSVLVFPKLFFPSGDPTLALLESLATFALAFIARPVGAVLFGHFGDRRGRKPALVAALLTMGLSAALIGILPGYSALGALAPLVLAACRFAQGLALGGEWGGAVLLATENARPDRRGWYGTCPQLGVPIGFLCAIGVFLLLSRQLSSAAFLDWGWRIPFLASSILVSVTSYARWRLSETRDFRRAVGDNSRVRVPLLTVCVEHPRALLLGTLAATGVFVLFYMTTVFYLVAIYSLKWGGDISQLGQGGTQFLIILMMGMLLMAVTVPLSAAIADWRGRRFVLRVAALATFGFGWAVAPLIGSGTVVGMLLFCLSGLALAGLYHGSLGVVLAGLFPTPVRYTGVSVTLSLAGAIGACLTPYVTSGLVADHGLSAVGGFLSAAGLLSLIAVLLMPDV